MLKIPYGQSNFKALIQGAFFYQDRTEYIRLMESDSRFLFFLRPRRFGKTLFVSTLRYYYGLEHKALWNELFSHLEIGRQPAPLANSYLVLSFEFSRINTDSEQHIQDGFKNAVLMSVREFLAVYGIYFTEAQKGEILSQTVPSEILRQLFGYHKINQVPHPIFITIDEYDHFANEIISFNFSLFSEIVSRNGFFRKFFEVIKTAAGEDVVQRTFITGVSPITLDSMTSGFNIATNISLELNYHQMMGFLETEVEGILSGIGVADTHREGVLSDLRSWYNGYLFNGEAPRRVYNPSMVLGFARYYQQYQQYPKDLLDANIASDYSKIRNLFKIQGREDQNLEALHSLTETGTVTTELTIQFSFERVFNQSDLVSLLFYMGFLTIKEDNGVAYIFQFPNYVIQRLYANYFVALTQEHARLPIDNEPLNKAIYALALQGDIQLFVESVEHILKHLLSNRDAQKFHEGSLKAIFVSLLQQQKFYYIHSEYESSRQYVDIFLETIHGYSPKFEIAIELKYVKKSDKRNVNLLLDEAEVQLTAYMISHKFNLRPNVKAFVIVAQGYKLTWRAVQL